MFIVPIISMTHSSSVSAVRLDMQGVHLTWILPPVILCGQLPSVPRAPTTLAERWQSNGSPSSGEWGPAPPRPNVANF